MEGGLELLILTTVGFFLIFKNLEDFVRGFISTLFSFLCCSSTLGILKISANKRN